MIAQPGKAIDIVEEPALARGRGLPAEAAVGIEHRQQRERDAGFGGGPGNCGAHRSGVGIGPPLRIVMHVMKFADAGEAGFQHFDIGQRGDGGEIVGAHAFDEAVHHFAPGPETVVTLPAALGQARHAALKGVAVQIAEAGKRDRMPIVAGQRGCAGFDRCDSACPRCESTDRDADIAGPAGGQVRGGKVKGLRHSHQILFARIRGLPGSSYVYTYS